MLSMNQRETRENAALLETLVAGDKVNVRRIGWVKDEVVTFVNLVGQYATVKLSDETEQVHEARLLLPLVSSI